MARPEGTKYIESPEEMERLFNEFVTYKKTHPVKVTDWVGKDATQVVRTHERPITLEGFSVWLNEKGVIKNVWHYFTNADGAYDDYLDICRIIKEKIRVDQIEGGMCGVYNPSITQRLNGLTDKKELDVKTEPRVFNVDHE